MENIKQILGNTRLKANERLLLYKIYIESDDNPLYEVDRKELADFINVKENMVFKLLQSLETQNYIERLNINDKSFIKINNINKKPYKAGENNNVISGKEKYNYQSIINAWNSAADEGKLSKLVKLTDKRKQKLKKRLDEIGEDDFINAIKKISESDFLTGKNSRNWKISFDWLIANDTNIVKVLEDKYSDKLQAEDNPWANIGYNF